MKQSRKALIIDDEKQIRRLLRLALEGADHQVFEAETGQAGLAEIVLRRPDVVLLDLGLPDMEGVKVLSRLREWSDVPVLILSVRDDAEDKVAALDAGADDYVTKPFDTAELLARVRVAQRRSLVETGEPVFNSGLLCVDFAAHHLGTVTRRGGGEGAWSDAPPRDYGTRGTQPARGQEPMPTLVLSEQPTSTRQELYRQRPG